MREQIDTAFLVKWRKEYYEREDRENYSNLIKKDVLTSKDVKTLLEWKSTRFSKKIKDKLIDTKTVKMINELRKKKPLKETEIDDFVKRFFPQYPHQAPVFGTFIKHILKPDAFPIYDRYVHRAYHNLKKISEHADCLMKCYNDYCVFLKETKKKLQCNSKELDEALWAYGYSL